MKCGFLFLPLLLLPLTACRDFAAVHPVITQGRAAEIRFPEPWIEQTSGNVKTLLPDGIYYEIRRRTGVRNNQLLFGGKSWVADVSRYPGKQPGDALYSENIYSVDLDRNYQVGNATREDWERAGRVSEEVRHQVIPRDKPAFDYDGMSIHKLGEHWGLASASTGGNWLVVFSYSGKETHGGIIPFLGGGVKNGDVYWEAYDVKARSKVMAWHANSVQSPAIGENAVWVEERYLVIPFQSGPNSFVIADLLNQN